MDVAVPNYLFNDSEVGRGPESFIETIRCVG